MYSRQEASQLRQEFWTTFGQYMAPVLSAEGEKINWINYKTREKGLHIRMAADNRMATIAIEIAFTDMGIQQLYFEQFLQLRKIFETIAGEGWEWLPAATNDMGKTVGRIQKELTGVSIFKKEDWPELISFFKKHIIELDAFWSEVKYSFEALR